MSVVMIGVDPHKASVSIEERDTVTERLVATGRFEMSTPGYRQLRALAKQWKDRVWAIEGTSGTGRPLAQRLLADGEVVLDVPAKLAARSRVFDTGQGRKTDAHDAHAIVMVALRDQGLRQVREDDALLMLRLLIDRRDELGKARVQGLSRLHRHFLHLIPGGAPTKKSVQQYRRLLATVRPRDPVGKARRRMAAEQVHELVRLDAQLKAMKTELKAAVLATGSRLMDLHGIGPVNAARILADVGDVARFPDRNHFASWTGTAPIDASSGQHIRHRLSRAGNRRVNHALHMAAVVHLRHDTDGRAYFRRKTAAGKTGTEAMRCLKRRLSDAVYRQLVADAAARQQEQVAAGAGGGRSGWAPRGVTRIQRGRPAPGHRHFGSATTRTRRPHRRPATGSRPDPCRGPDSRPTASVCPRCQRAAPHRTNDVDTDQRRRILTARAGRDLTTDSLEGSHVRTFPSAGQVSARRRVFGTRSRAAAAAAESIVIRASARSWVTALYSASDLSPLSSLSATFPTTACGTWSPRGLILRADVRRRGGAQRP